MGNQGIVFFCWEIVPNIASTSEFPSHQAAAPSLFQTTGKRDTLRITLSPLGG